MKDLVSIIVPVYNVEEYLERCIESIINQTYQNLEIILIDDGSIDNSANIMKKYERMDKRIITIFKENFGAPSARNRGIELATGKYMMFFDSDDELYENAIENMVMNIQDADMIIGNWSYIDLNNNVIKKEQAFKNQLYDKEAIKRIITYLPFPGNKLYRSEIIKSNKLYFDNVRIGQDLNFYIKFTHFCNKFATTQSLIFKYRITDNSISRTYNLNILDIVNSIEKAKDFLIKSGNNFLNDSIINELKIKHYKYQLNKIVKYDKTYGKIILLYFHDELKKIDTSECSPDIKKEYKKMIMKCSLLKIINPKIYARIGKIKK